MSTTDERMTGAQSLIRSMEYAGVDVAFGIPGGAILPAYDPLMDSAKVRHILVRHEQAAGHAAEGYAAATGRVGVCMATSGPGATNLVTPIADAHMDSVPMVAITGQVPSSAIGTDAFQEADIRGITMPITKHNYLVTNPDEIPCAIAEAFHLASTGRPGPVLVDVSKDALQGMTTFEWPEQINLDARADHALGLGVDQRLIHVLRGDSHALIHTGGLQRLQQLRQGRLIHSHRARCPLVSS